MTEQRARHFIVLAASVAIALFTLVEVNLARLTPLTGLALFTMLGLVAAFMIFPAARRFAANPVLRASDYLLAAASVACCAYLIVENKDLSGRAGVYTTADIVVGVAGILLVLESTRRSIGIALPILSILFIVYAFVGPELPDWLFPHRGYDSARVVGQTFLRSEGVFGTALRVMFTYVFLFILFGTFLEATGATQFIIDFAGRLFGRTPGGPAKVAVLSSGFLGSLSGSAVANAVTSGTFTIPMMRASGFSRPVAGGIEASASSGGALVPPVMGAGAYMMLEIIDPPVTYLQVIKAAIIPAILYYFSIFMFVHFYSRRIGSGEGDAPSSGKSLLRMEAIIFLGSLGSLMLFLFIGYSPFRAVTYALGVLVALSLIHGPSRLSFSGWLSVAERTARAGVPLICASACVGIVIGIVVLTGVGTAFPNSILPLAERSLFLALLAIMFSSLVLGMGLPSAVCYLLLATLIGPVLGRLGVPLLAAHMFIFYFGLMSMVTPPVALAAYATASIANAPIMKTGIEAFRFSLVGFILPFMFVYRPQLLLIPDASHALPILPIVTATLVAVVGVIGLASALAGYLFTRIAWPMRFVLIVASMMLLYPGRFIPGPIPLGYFDVAGGLLFLVACTINWRTRSVASAVPASSSVPPAV